MSDYVNDQTVCHAEDMNYMSEYVYLSAHTVTVNSFFLSVCFPIIDVQSSSAEISQLKKMLSDLT